MTWVVSVMVDFAEPRERLPDACAADVNGSGSPDAGDIPVLLDLILPP
jgi:hypothetical protein